MSDKKRQPSTWLGHASLGFEFASAVVALTLLGYWFDRHFDSQPWGILIGFGCGVTGGLYNLVRASFSTLKTTRKRNSKANDGESG